MAENTMGFLWGNFISRHRQKIAEDQVREGRGRERVASHFGVLVWKTTTQVIQRRRVGKIAFPRWWFQRFFGIFTPKIGEMIEFDSYFSDGLKPPTRF